MTKPMESKELKQKAKQKKIDRAGVRGSKVVFANTYESKALLELTIESDRLFRAMRNGVDLEKSASNIKKGRAVICGLSDFLHNLSNEMELNYMEPSIVTELKRITKT